MAALDRTAQAISTTPFRFGDIVGFASPDLGEQDARFVVLWIDRERCKVRELHAGLNIPPVAIFDVKDMRLLTPRDNRLLSLQHYAQLNGATLKIGAKSLTFLGASRDGDIAVGTFQAVRARYQGVMQPGVRVAGRPGCEVWCVLSGSRTIARFAIGDDGALYPIAQ